ncbi:MAG: hypothetical protein CMG78_12155 [Marinobacter sp.]|nr:hypothetical protein [Marinobacter sp.]|tara:strand:- start:430 stop:642 length:213 start_codon:yes stop_codon:yes gene_type:complete
MKIRFKETVELDIVANYEEDGDTFDTELEVISVGDEHEVDVIEDKGDAIDIQFGDGSMALNVQKAWFTFI